MAVTATLRQWRTETLAGKFRLESQIVAASGLGTLKLFTISSLDDSYIRVSDVRDIEHYGETPAAPDPYRVDQTAQEFDTIEDAQVASDLQKTQIQSLVSDWDVFDNQFRSAGDVHTKTTGDTSATINQVRSVLTDGTFQIVATVTDASGFTNDSEELFLFDLDGDSYQHVARVGDMETYWPQGAVGHEDDPYYRKDAATTTFTTVSQAMSASDAQKQGITDLVDDYEATKDTYETPTYEDTSVTS